MITSVTVTRTRNLGGYESLHLAATASVQGDDDTAISDAFDEARAAVEAEYLRQPPLERPAEPPASDKQRNYIARIQDELTWTSEQLAVYANEQGIDLVSMTKTQASALIDGMKRLADQAAGPPPF